MNKQRKEAGTGSDNCVSQEEFKARISMLCQQIREEKPLIHFLTNYVTANDCANITLAAGASPVMASDCSEVEEMAAMAGAVVLNIGTISSLSAAAMLAAGKKANSLGIPVILDPVGVGATKMRTETAKQILAEVAVDILRGNMSEIKVLAGCAAGIRGVDSTAAEADGREVAIALAQKLNCVVAVTGQTDIIAGKEGICLLGNGHAWLRQVTGTGCMATALVGSCAAVSKNSFAGAVAGIAMMGIAGEIAKASLTEADGIGTFRLRLFDAIFSFTPQILRQYGKINYQPQS